MSGAVTILGLDMTKLARQRVRGHTLVPRAGHKVHEATVWSGVEDTSRPNLHEICTSLAILRHRICTIEPPRHVLVVESFVQLFSQASIINVRKKARRLHYRRSDVRCRRVRREQYR